MRLHKHPHVCGAKDLEGFNWDGFSPERCIKWILEEVPTYQKPYKNNLKAAGWGYYTVCAAEDGRVKYRYRDNPFTRLRRFKRYVKEHGLGTVTLGPVCDNPNYAGTHKLLPGIFVPDNDGMIKWGIERKILKPLKENRSSNRELYAFWAQSVLDRVDREGR